MDTRYVSWLMCAVDCVSILAAILVAAVVVPQLQQAGTIPDGSTVGFALGVLPLIGAGVVGFKLFWNIGKGSVFTHSNAKLLVWMGAASFLSAFVWLCELGYLILAQLAAPISAVSTLCIALIASVALASIAFALSLLCSRAADIKSENDLTV